TLEEIFSRHSFETWRKMLATMSGAWAPALSPEEIAVDPQVTANGYFPEVKMQDGRTFRSVASPIQFGELPLGNLKGMPEHAQHTEEVLVEAGFTWNDLVRLKEVGAIS